MEQKAWLRCWHALPWDWKASDRIYQSDRDRIDLLAECGRYDSARLERYSTVGWGAGTIARASLSP